MVLLLLGYVLRKNGRGLRDLGFRWSLGDASWGAVVAIAAYALSIAAGVTIALIHRSIWGTIPTTFRPTAFFGHPSALMVVYFLLGPVCEELIVRAYLMTEIRELTGSAALAVFLSVALQGSYHLYYGWFQAVVISFQFLVFALYYSRWRKALPIVVAHELIDIVALTRM